MKFVWDAYRLSNTMSNSPEYYLRGQVICNSSMVSRRREAFIDHPETQNAMLLNRTIAFLKPSSPSLMGLELMCSTYDNILTRFYIQGKKIQVLKQKQNAAYPDRTVDL